MAIEIAIALSMWNDAHDTHGREREPLAGILYARQRADEELQFFVLTEEPDVEFIERSGDIRVGLVWPTKESACDDKAACEKKMEKMCQDAKKGGADSGSVELKEREDGSKICSANCQQGGAIAFVECAAPPKPPVTT